MQGPEKKSKHQVKRIIVGVFVLLIFFIQIFVFIPKPANALFGVGDINFSTTIGDIPRKVWDAIKEAVKKSGDIAFKNALRTFTQQIAYDAAVKIASGAAGQEPLFHTEPWGKSLLNAGNAAVGDFLDTLYTDAWGISLCDIDPVIKTNIQLSVGLDLGLEQPRQAKCTATSVLGKFTDGSLFETNIDVGFAIKGVDPAQLSRVLLQEFPDLFGEEQSNVGQYLKVYREAAEKKSDAEEEELKAQEKDFEPLTSPITGDIKTPASTIEATQDFALSETTTAEEVNTGSIIADMVGVFTNTLAKKYMEFILVKGLNPAADSTSGTYGGTQSGRSSGIAAAEARFASFNQPALGAGGSVDILNTLSSCPTDFAEPENCVIDSSFRTAIEQQLRLEEAIELGYINGNKPFGYGDGGSQLNYTEGYPYRSLVLLRRYRIIPVSWELAASYIREFGGGGRSLNDLIQEYDNETSQYYQLIDPDWVLKAPANQCVNSGYGETRVFDEYIDIDGNKETPKVRQIQRNTTCVDDQSCILEDEAGNCQEYGYCTKEDPIWRFNGETCPDYYNSCTTYVDRQGQPASYLKDTLDFNGCSADNVGCQWYCKEYNDTEDRWECYWDDLSDDDYSHWSDGIAPPWGFIGPAGTYEEWMSHLTAGAEECTAEAAGCNEYIRTTHGTNLLDNASFEYYTGDPDDAVADAFNSWDPFSGGITEAVTPNTPNISPYSGITALNMRSGTAPLNENIRFIYESGSPVRERSFTFSVYAMSDFTDGACDGNAEAYISSAFGSETQGVVIDNVSDQWQRYEVSIDFSDALPTTPVVWQNVYPFIYADTGCNIIFDAAMLEESTSASQYADYGAINKIYLTGERETCDPDDVGCQWYTPLAGGERIPAQIKPADQCSSQDVGCKAFEEVPLTNIIPDPNHVERFGTYCHGDPAFEGNACLLNSECGVGFCLPSISLVPDTGLQCSVAHVGCEEYTNLDEVSAGGEGKEYYTFLKQCVPTSDPDIDTYYAWEGDAVAGYQLRAFRLKRSNIVYTGGPVEVGNAPCTHLNVDPDPANLTCVDTNANVAADSECSAVYGTDPDCTQFFDASLNVFYRYKTKTISVTDDCHPERNSIDGNIYYGSPEESRSCPAEFAGCREYLGNSGYNYRQIFFDDFEDGTTQGWSPGTVSNDSVIVGGHSLTFNVDTEKPVTVEEGKTYELRFWGRSDVASDRVYVKFDTAAYQFPTGGDTWFADDISGTLPPRIFLVPEWREWRLGPVTIDDISDPNRWNGLPGTLQFLSVSAQDYIDNVELIETTSSEYLVRDSFRTCYGSENCEAYSDIDGNIHYLKSFDKLCDESVAGCEALIDTKNNTNPFAEEFGDPAQVQSFITVPQDETVRFINNQDVRCASGDKGCAELGEPILDQDNNLTGYETVYIKDNADLYSDIWCDHSEVGCEEYGVSGSTGKTFFKDPAGRLCEYKQLYGSYDYDWYVAGTEDVCDKTPTPPSPAIPAFVCEGGNPAPPPGTVCNPDNPIECTGGSRCVPWVGVCEERYNGCTAYRDPMDPVDCQPNCPYELDGGVEVLFDENCVPGGGFPGCQTYYNIDTTVDSTSCNGVVNEEKGCKLFNNTSLPPNTFSADISPDGMEKYCTLDPADVTYYGQSCDTDADCGPAICFENPEFGPPVNGRWGTCSGGSNPGDPCTPTGLECLGGGVCNIYGPDNSPYNDSNTVLKVRRDRICEEWLYCKTSFEVDDKLDLDGDGKTKEEVCFEIGLCNELGPSGLCTGTISPGPANVTGDTAAYSFDDFQNLSGFVSAGLHYGCRDDHSVSCTVATELTDCAGLGDECHIIEGLYPYSEMFEVGMGGAITKDLVSFGDFESDAINGFMVCASTQENSGDSCIIDDNCIPDEDQTAFADCIDVDERPGWSPIFPALDSKIIVVEGDETEGNPALDENNYLLYTAGAQGVCDDLSDNEGTPCTLAGGECTGGGSCEFGGLGAMVDLGTNILNNSEYIASLDFRFEDLPEVGSEEIAVSLAQFDGVNILGENLLGYFDGSTGWTQQILEPVEVTGIPDENDSTYLLIRNMNGNVSFAIDNVSMKPALAVKAYDSPGIRGDYYTFVYNDIGVNGLNEECFTDTNLTVPCAGNPYIVPTINWYEPCVACVDGGGTICNLCGDGILPVDIPGEMDPLIPDNGNFITSLSSARWEGGINIPTSGFHTLFFNANDGFRLWVDDMSPGAEIVSYWGSIPTLGYMWSQYFTAGWHPIKLEFNNASAYGGLQFGRIDGQWNPTDCGGGIPNAFCINYAWDENGDGVIDPRNEGMLDPSANRIPAIPNAYIVPPNDLTTELEQVFGTYLNTYVSDNLNYPAPDMSNLLIDQTGTDEMIAVRWTGKILIETPGDHIFGFVTNDGFKFYIDDLTAAVADYWFDDDHSVSVTVPALDAGWHPIMIEYYQKLDDSYMVFSWQPPGAPLQTIVPAENLSTMDGDEAYIVRSCRAYPREDSEVCQYTNSDLVEFNGWQGYCIETDPTNADKCITWWPVDVISGESSVFGTVDPAGYQGRRPLYMCVESTGNFDSVNTFNTFNGFYKVNWTAKSCNDDGDNATGYGEWPVAPMWNDIYGYRRPVTTSWVSFQNDGDNDCDGNEGDSCGGLGDNGNEVPGCEEGAGSAGGDFFGFCGCQDHTVIDRNIAANAADQFYEWEIDRIEWTVQRASHGDWPDGQTTWVANIENSWEIDWSGSNNRISIDVNFDANNLLSSFDVVMVDGSHASGGAWVTGTIFLRDVCKEIAKVVTPTDDKAWAQRTANTSSYLIRDLLYSYNSDSAPFGAIVAGQGDDPGDSWDSSVALGLQPVLLENFDNTPPPVVNNTRSGSPYSCDGDCVPKVCFGGAYDTAAMANQVSCTTDADCEPSAGERGVCVGVGYCSDEPTVACSTTAQCTAINGGACVGAAARNAGDGNFDTGNVWAIDNIQRIFAYVYGAWRWNDAGAFYEVVSNTPGTWLRLWNDEFDAMPLCDGDGTGPRPIWPPDNDLCGILPVADNILVNGTTGDVDLFGGGTITLTFTSFVDPEQEELRNIVVDWGDGSTSSIVWNGAPKSDPSQPHLMSHTYEDPGAIQVYNIEIMLVDNWGFCNDQSEGSPGNRPCAIDAYDYQEFGGVINVYPS